MWSQRLRCRAPGTRLPRRPQIFLSSSSFPFRGGPPKGLPSWPRLSGPRNGDCRSLSADLRKWQCPSRLRRSIRHRRQAHHTLQQRPVLLSAYRFLTHKLQRKLHSRTKRTVFGHQEIRLLRLSYGSARGVTRRIAAAVQEFRRTGSRKIRFWRWTQRRPDQVRAAASSRQIMARRQHYPAPLLGRWAFDWKAVDERTEGRNRGSSSIGMSVKGSAARTWAVVRLATTKANTWLVQAATHGVGAAACTNILTISILSRFPRTSVPRICRRPHFQAIFSVVGFAKSACTAPDRFPADAAGPGEIPCVAFDRCGASGRRALCCRKRLRYTPSSRDRSRNFDAAERSHRTLTIESAFNGEVARHPLNAVGAGHLAACAHRPRLHFAVKRPISHESAINRAFMFADHRLSALLRCQRRHYRAHIELRRTGHAPSVVSWCAPPVKAQVMSSCSVGRHAMDTTIRSGSRPPIL